MIIKVASAGEFQLGSPNNKLTYRFNEKALEQLAKSLKGKKVYNNGIVFGKVNDAFYKDGFVYADVELNDLSIVPGYTITSTEEDGDVRVIKTARSQELALTVKPTDSSVSKLQLDSKPELT